MKNRGDAHLSVGAVALVALGCLTGCHSGPGGANLSTQEETPQTRGQLQVEPRMATLVPGGTLQITSLGVKRGSVLQSRAGDLHFTTAGHHGGDIRFVDDTGTEGHWVYTAPKAAGVFPVHVTDTRDRMLKARVDIKVEMPTPSSPVILAQRAVTVPVGGRVVFTAVDARDPAQRATQRLQLTVVETLGGIIESPGTSSPTKPLGTYVAPSHAGTYQVSLTGLDDPTIRDRAWITVVPGEASRP